MKHSINLFLVTSPFQYICALEAKAHYGADNSVLVLMAQSGALGVQQQSKLFNPEDWGQVVHLERRSRSTTIPQCIRKVKKLAKGKGIDGFYHGEYSSWHAKLFVKNLKPNREIIFDDGTLTINDYEESIRHRIPFVRPLSKVFSDLTVLVNGCYPVRKLEQHKNLEIFTIFDLENPNHKVERNDFSVLRKKYGNPRLFNKHAPVGIIGQGGVGSKYQKTIGSYVNEISKLIDFLGSDVVYFPHRTESDELTKEIEKLPNLKYHRSELPLEIELIDKGILLSGLVGCNSTAQFSALIMYPGIKVYNILLSDKGVSELSAKNLKRAENITLALEALGVERIML